MIKDDFIKWRASQVTKLPTTQFTKWWSKKIRQLYSWLLHDS